MSVAHNLLLVDKVRVISCNWLRQTFFFDNVTLARGYAMPRAERDVDRTRGSSTSELGLIYRHLGPSKSVENTLSLLPSTP